MKDNKKPTILVSSTVYGFEELLELIYTLLTRMEYEVWMSHKGTIPINPNFSAFENCLAATEKCDLFLGIITPFYGSGKNNEDDLSITHQELTRAIELNKPRWLLVHDHVVFTRSFLDHLRLNGEKIDRRLLSVEKNPEFGHLRVLEMFETAANLDSNKPLEDRTGNWVQKFQSDADASLFAIAQFSRYHEVEKFLKENLRDKSRVSRAVKGKEDSA